MSCFLGTAITYSEDIKRVREAEIKKRRSKKAISFLLKLQNIILHISSKKVICIYQENTTIAILVVDFNIIGNSFNSR